MLKIIKNVLDRFEQESIIYCHWKSNERLAEFVKGEEDLDLLFYPEDEERVHRALITEGAKKFEAIPIGKYKNIKDYLVYDEDTGKLIHFHVHFGLDVGEKDVKRYRLPWTEKILKSRVKHESINIYTVSVEHEFLLLIVREVLRRPPHKFYLTRFRIEIKNSIKNEFEWLIKRIDNTRLYSLCDMLIPELKSELQVIIDDGWDKNTLIRCRKKLKKFRQSTKSKSSLVTEYQLIKGLISSKVNLFKNVHKLPNQRINPSGGSIVAFIGSDGAGKSTTVDNIYNFFDKKLDVATIYMGNPKVQDSKFPFLIKVFKKIKIYPFWNLFVKKRNIHKAQKLRDSGVLVLLDRLPQADYNGIMDGPMLSDWLSSKNPILQWVCKKEADLFRILQSFDVDILFKLKVNIQTSMKRGKIPEDTARQKTKIVIDISYPHIINVHDINTVKNSTEQVNRNVTSKIWKQLK